MTSFMGPMAPPPPAQPQPQALDIRTNPNQRQQFKQFMRQRMMPMTSAPIAQPPMQPMMQSPAMFNMGGGVDIFDPMYSAPMMAPPAPMGFQRGGSVSAADALADALSDDVGDYSFDDTMTDLSQTSYDDFDTGGDDDFQASAMDQFRGQQVSDLSSNIGQQIQNVIDSNQRMGTPAPVPQANIQPNIQSFQPFDPNQQNPFISSRSSSPAPVSAPEPVSSFPTFNMRGKSVTFDLLGNPLTIGFEDGGAVPPRRADIGGQDHMLSYITPDEADILKALGGSGEPGPMGIPAFRADPGQMAEAQESLGQTDYGGGDPSDTFSDPASDPGGIGGTDPAGETSFSPDFGDDGSSDADEVGDAIAEQIVIDQILGGGGGGTPRSRINRVPTETTQLLNAFGSDVRSGRLRDDELAGMPSQYTEIPDMAMGRPDPNVNMFDDFDDVADPVGSIASTITKSRQEAPDLLGIEDEYDDLTKEEEIARNIGYTDAGLPRGLDFIDTPQGRMTTNLAGTTAAQRAAMPGYMNTRADVLGVPSEKGDLRGGIAQLVDTIVGNPLSSAYGYEIPDYDPKDPDASSGEITGFTGRSNLPGLVTGLQNFIMGPPKDTKDLLQRGVYTGFGPGSQIGIASGSDDDPSVKSPTDPCPDGFVMKNGACTPIDSGAGDGNPSGIGGIGTGQPPPPPAPVIVPSPRQPVQTNLQGPVGYGMPTAGQINPFAVSSAGLYQQMLNQQAMNAGRNMPISNMPLPAPTRLQQGGPVSSNLDRAADNFLKALMPAA